MWTISQMLAVALVVVCLEAVSSQQPPPAGSIYLTGGPPPSSQHQFSLAKPPTMEFSLSRLLSSLRGGMRGRFAPPSQSQLYSTIVQSQPPPPPQSLNYLAAPSTKGAFYITPPEKNAPFYYGSNGVAGAGKPQMVRISDLKSARPYSLLTSATSNGPTATFPQFQMIPFGIGPAGGIAAPPGYQFRQVSAGNLVAAASTNPASAGTQQQAQPQSSSNQAGSLQEIIAKAAQEQHNRVIQKEQKAHPNALITNSQIHVPAGAPQQQQQIQHVVAPQGLNAFFGPPGANLQAAAALPGGGRQPVFINQFGQPYLAPAILSTGQRGGPNPQLQLQQQIPNGLQQQQALGLQQYLASNGLAPGQGAPQQQLPFRLLHSVNPLAQQPGGQQDQQAQLLQAQGIPLLRGAPGQHPALQGLVGNPFAAYAGGQFIPGNAVLGQPHYAIMSGNLQGFSGGQPQLINLSQGQGNEQQQQQQHQQQGQKEEQPNRQDESATEVKSTTTSLEPSVGNSYNGQIQSAIMQSAAEYTEPITKL